MRAALLSLLAATCTTVPLTGEARCTLHLREWESLLCGNPCSGVILNTTQNSVTLGRGEHCNEALAQIGILTIDEERYRP